MMFSISESIFWMVRARIWRYCASLGERTVSEGEKQRLLDIFITNYIDLREEKMHNTKSTSSSPCINITNHTNNTE